MANYLPTEEQKALLRQRGWKCETDCGGVSAWTLGNPGENYIVFRSISPPSVRGDKALIMCEWLEVSPGKAVVDGVADGMGIIGRISVPSCFSGKKMRIVWEVIED